ncbi:MULTISPECIES: branched-chain amino acid ABC transporter permease [Halococcus]|uniref:High-affinity branched-chain amino acid transport protein n=1 Tax=Halococcus salifodinae DSM 8989 TaxID=1227456 RepID=M0N5X4_9EURY|nr:MULTISPECIES: branched-chain amino acid ABC transporter permease [Halococcus]EMA53337.1 high-affinity branched-chain amino acid transport protein [Halococcus salifodinae DSM 8989]
MSTADRLSERLGGSDAGLILGVMAGLYVLFIVFGLILGLDVGGIASTLQRLTFLAAVYALLALALNLQWGYAGLFNIGVAGFMAVGAYTMAMLTAPVDPQVGGIPGLGLPLWAGIIGGMAAAALVGGITALPALRLRADYLAIVTLALSEIIRLIYNSTTFQSFSVAGRELGTGGASGIPGPINPVRDLYYTDPASSASPPTAFGEAMFGFFGGFGLNGPTVVDWTYTLVLVVFVGLFYLLLTRVGNSPFGRVLKAIREDEIVASSLGKNTRWFKIKVFMLGCALMGLAGILWQGSQALITPALFLPIVTFYVFIALMIGGSGSNTGSVIGGALFAGLLFLGPTFVGRIVDSSFSLGGAPNTFTAAVAALGSFDITPLIAYALDNISVLRFVLLGVVLVVLMQRRPEGLLGHRKEPAAAVDLSRRSVSGDDSAGAARADGGVSDATDAASDEGGEDE